MVYTQQVDTAMRQARYRSLGKKLLIIPLAINILVLFIYPLLTFAAMHVDYQTVSFIQVARVILSIISTLAIIAFVPCCFAGAILLGRAARMFDGARDERSGKGNSSEVPEEIKGWNWGAAGLTWIWGASHAVWLSFLVFVPFVGLFMWIILGLRGSEWAWQSSPWQSVEHFQTVQKKWKIWGIILLALGMVRLVGAVVLLALLVR